MSNIVLIHGYPLDASVYSGVIPLIDPTHVVIAPDLAGFGKQPWPTDGDLSMEAQARHVFDAMDRVGMKAAVIVGLSMGGYVALAMAEAEPDRVEALGLVGSKPDADTNDARTGRDNQAASVVDSGADGLVAPMTAALLGPNANIFARARLRTMVESTRAETYVSALAGMRDRSDRTHVVAGFDGPIAVLVGTQDPVVSLESATKTAEIAANGSVEVLEGIGHLAPMESPADVADFVNSLARRVT